MSREWKPGDVAMVNGFEDGPLVGIVRPRKQAGPGVRLEFAYEDGNFDMVSSVEADDDYTARPLVVIDPEDSEQVERLARALPEDWSLLSHPEDAIESLTAIANALREFAKPKQPECRASLNVHIEERHVAASCAEPVGHEGSHRSANGTHWDCAEVSL